MEPTVFTEPARRRPTRAVRSLYEASFPDHERCPWPTLAAALKNGSRVLLRADDPEGRLLGLAVLVPLPDCHAVLLDYLAVDPAARRAGVGTDLVRASQRYARDHGLHAGVVAEVEPDTADDPDARQVQVGRLAFYARLGASALPVRYAAPRADGDGGYPLLLMHLPAPVEGRAFRSRPLQIMPTVEAIYRAIYAGRPHSDDVLRSIRPGR